MKLSRLRGSKTAARIMKHGQVWKGTTMTIRYLMGAPKHPLLDPDDNVVYLGTFASAKLHKSAVKRNRMRRRCREAMRRAIADAKKLPTVQLLISPRSPSLGCDFGEVQADVATFLSEISS